jgi:hypothetical protein
MQSSVDPTLFSGSDASFDYVFSISNSIPDEQWGNPLSLNMFPPSLGMVSFDWNDLLESRLPFFTSFQIKVKINSTSIYRCIVNEGSSASILSSLSWKELGSPKLVSATSELLAFDNRPTECLGILP